MLTAELVRARRRGGELKLTALDAKGVAQAQELAAALLELARRHVGRSRDELEEVCDAVVGGAKDRKLAAGLRKLVYDRCDFAEDATIDPVELRREVHASARAAWLALAPEPATMPATESATTPAPEPTIEPTIESSTEPSTGPDSASALLGQVRFDRHAVLAQVATARALDVATIEASLYADLRGAQLLRGVEPTTPQALVEAYELAQAQAVLLRAVRVTVQVESAVPGAYRTLFRKLKFLRLLTTIHPRAEGGYLLEIDGPFSLFESATRYGLALALALPAIRELDRWQLSADVRWGNDRQPLTCRLEGRGMPGQEPLLSDELAALIAATVQTGTAWQVQPATAVLELTGVGVCVPDLVFRHPERGVEVFVEVLGYWSRAAVWKRVELVQQGLRQRIVFAVGQHLRVSEAALEAELPGALYVYKRTLSARALLERIEQVAAQPG